MFNSQYETNCILLIIACWALIIEYYFSFQPQLNRIEVAAIIPSSIAHLFF
jgi:hypothetical protein